MKGEMRCAAAAYAPFGPGDSAHSGTPVEAGRGGRDTGWCAARGRYARTQGAERAADRPGLPERGTGPGPGPERRSEPDPGCRTGPGRRPGALRAVCGDGQRQAALETRARSMWRRAVRASGTGTPGAEADGTTVRPNMVHGSFPLVGGDGRSLPRIRTGRQLASHDMGFHVNSVFPMRDEAHHRSRNVATMERPSRHVTSGE